MLIYGMIGIIIAILTRKMLNMREQRNGQFIIVKIIYLENNLIFSLIH